jgi:hypothetical protein
MTVKTKTVEGRRTVHYNNWDDLLADAHRLADAEVNMVGNWTLGQVFGHLANGMDASIDGFPGNVPWPMRIFAKMFMRNMILRGPLRPGFKLPKAAESTMVPPTLTSTADGLDSLERAVQRQKSENRRVPHLALGNISVDDWTKAHLRHAELHMSFAVPKD